MFPQNHLALACVSSKQLSLTFWGISGMQDNAVRCDGCAIKSACVAPVALGEQILERVRKANRQGSESCRPRRAIVSHPHSGGVWARPPTGRPSSEEVQGPLVVCWPHTQKRKKEKEKERQKEEETSAATKVFKQESARAEQLCGSE